MSLVLPRRERNRLLKEKVDLLRMAEMYQNEYEGNGSPKAAETLKRIVSRLKEVNGILGVTHQPKIRGLSSLAKGAVGG